MCIKVNQTSYSHIRHVSDIIDIVTIIFQLLNRLAYGLDTIRIGKLGFVGDHSLLRCHLSVYYAMASST